MGDSLFSAVFMNNLETIEKLIAQQDLNINEKDQLGRTPLQIACYFGFYEAAKLLLENDAIIDRKCFYWAKNGWDGHTQHEIIDLLKSWEKES